MFLNQFAAQALNNCIKLDFARLQVTAKHAMSLFSTNGTGTAYIDSDHFRICFYYCKPLGRVVFPWPKGMAEFDSITLEGQERKGDVWQIAPYEVYEDLTPTFLAREIKRIKSCKSAVPHQRLIVPCIAPLPPSIPQRNPKREINGFQLEVVVRPDYLEIVLFNTSSSEVCEQILDALQQTFSSPVVCVYREVQFTAEQHVILTPKGAVAPLNLVDFPGRRLLQSLQNVALPRKANLR